MPLLADSPPIAFVATADRVRAEAFYAEVVGLAVLARDGFATTFALAGGATMRLTPSPGHVAHAHTVLGWGVADIVAAVADLRGKGAAFVIYEGFGQDADGIWQAPGDGTKVAWFKDPDDNLLSLTQFA